RRRCRRSRAPSRRPSSHPPAIFPCDRCPGPVSGRRGHWGGGRSDNEAGMDRLLEGYRRFRVTTWPGERELYRTLAESGQHPETLVIACSDSRADPQLVFNARPGELFVLRNVAGLVPPY